MTFQQQTIVKETITVSISPDFDLFADSLPLDEIKKVLEMPMNETDLKTAIGYVICRRLEGINIFFPKKAHKNEFAKLLIQEGAQNEDIANNLEVHIKTIKRIQQKGNDEQQSK